MLRGALVFGTSHLLWPAEKTSRERYVPHVRKLIRISEATANFFFLLVSCDLDTRINVEQSWASQDMEHQYYDFTLLCRNGSHKAISYCRTSNFTTIGRKQLFWIFSGLSLSLCSFSIFKKFKKTGLLSLDISPGKPSFDLPTPKFKRSSNLKSVLDSGPWMES